MQKKAILRGSDILMEFDIFRYVSIFLTSFGHNLGTNPHHIFQGGQVAL